MGRNRSKVKKPQHLLSTLIPHDPHTSGDVPKQAFSPGVLKKGPTAAPNIKVSSFSPKTEPGESPAPLRTPLMQADQLSVHVTLPLLTPASNFFPLLFPLPFPLLPPTPGAFGSCRPNYKSPGLCRLPPGSTTCHRHCIHMTEGCHFSRFYPRPGADPGFGKWGCRSSHPLLLPASAPGATAFLEAS